jgi:murein DD-endopeptidase MepM/ murein hydrolase activator NlpD
MDNQASRRFPAVAAMLAATLSLSGCAGDVWSDRGLPVAQPTAQMIAAPPVRTIGAVPRSKPAALAAAAWRAQAQAKAPPKPPQASLAWPVQGAIRRGYGEQPSGARNDGLDITAAEGAPVLAVDDGVVRYAGGDLPGYGNMLLVAHAGGFTSVYAHNQALLVGVGAEVRRGQPIATVGRSGGVLEAQLHFQLRAGDRPIDPEPYLEPAVTMVASLAPAMTSPLAAR